MKTLKIVAIIGVLSLWANLQSMAVTDLILYEGLPDLAGGTPGMDVTYDAGSDTFLASGYTFDYNISDGHGGATDIGVSVPDTYILSATINHSGVLTGGTLAINGAVGDGDTSVTLLTGNLVTGAAGTALDMAIMTTISFSSCSLLTVAPLRVLSAEMAPPAGLFLIPFSMAIPAQPLSLVHGLVTLIILAMPVPAAGTV